MRVIIYGNFIRFLPHWLVLKSSIYYAVLLEDLDRWSQIIYPGINSKFKCFILLLFFFPAYRNLFYSRIRNESRIKAKLLAIIARPQPLLDIDTSNAGGGLYIQHGYATIISAKKIGKNCWINQNVTLGYTNETDAPTLGDNVRVGAGAKVLGEILIGNNVIIGANCVVTKNVPDNCTVAGNPAIIIKMNGVKLENPQKL